MTYGLDTGPLPEGEQPLEAIAVVKCLSADGDGPEAVHLSTRGSDGLNIWEAIGMLDCARRDLLDQYAASLDDDGE